MRKLFILLLCTISIHSIQAQTMHNDSLSIQHKKHERVKSQYSIHVGTIFDTVGAGPTLDIDVGGRLGEFFYLGIKSGFHSYFAPVIISDGILLTKQHMWTGYIPLGINIKLYLLDKTAFCPYLDCSFDGGIVVSKNDFVFNSQAGIGAEYKRFSFGIGYNGLINRWTKGHSGYIKIGITLCK